MKEMVKKILVFDIELFLLRNMTSVIIFILGIIWLIYSFGKIDIAYSLACSGAIIAFWYSYKRYEINEEIEIIKKFKNKYWEFKKNSINIYNTQKNNKYDNKSFEECLIFYEEILHNWQEFYFLRNNQYISNKLWKNLEYWITEEIKEILSVDFDSFKSRFNNKSHFNGKEMILIMDLSPFLLSLRVFIGINNEQGGDDYYKFLLKKIMSLYLKDEYFIFKEYDALKKDKKIIDFYKKGLYEYLNLSL